MSELVCKTCPNEITKREARLNAGLCDDCMTKALALAAKDIARNLPGSAGDSTEG